MPRGRPKKIMQEPIEHGIIENIISIEPPMNYKLGDLTPEYIEWYYNNHSQQDFNIKYIKRRNRINPKYFS